MLLLRHSPSLENLLPASLSLSLSLLLSSLSTHSFVSKWKRVTQSTKESLATWKVTIVGTNHTGKLRKRLTPLATSTPGVCQCFSLSPSLLLPLIWPSNYVWMQLNHLRREWICICANCNLTICSPINTTLVTTWSTYTYQHERRKTFTSEDIHSHSFEMSSRAIFLATPYGQPSVLVLSCAIWRDTMKVGCTGKERERERETTKSRGGGGENVARNQFVPFTRIHIEFGEWQGKQLVKANSCNETQTLGQRGEERKRETKNYSKTNERKKRCRWQLTPRASLLYYSLLAVLLMVKVTGISVPWFVSI